MPVLIVQTCQALINLDKDLSRQGLPNYCGERARYEISSSQSSRTAGQPLHSLVKKHVAKARRDAASLYTTQPIRYEKVGCDEDESVEPRKVPRKRRRTTKPNSSASTSV